MDIQELVKKHVSLYRVKAHHSVRVAIRAALTELAAEYERETELLRAQLKYTLAQAAERDARITQLEAERVPEGWKLVPVEPTPDMIDAVLWYANGDYLKLLDEDLLRIEIWHDWRAMLAAAPQPTKEGE